MADLHENCIEWITGQNILTATIHQERLRNKLRKMAENDPRIQIIKENADGTILAHIPRDYLKISPKRRVSEAQREAAKKNMTAMRSGQS